MTNMNKLARRFNEVCWTMWANDRIADADRLCVAWDKCCERKCAERIALHLKQVTCA